MQSQAYVRIGELARRTGVSPELLRAWERRYGLLRPARSQGGFRLYSDADEARIHAMQELLRQGVSAAEAARLALDEGAAAAALEPAPSAATAELLEAVLAFDDMGANAALDRLLAAFSVETVLQEVVLPLLRELGERWERGETTIGQEHFASNLLRGRLLGLARGWDRGAGRRALLAAPPGELHDLGLIALGLALRGEGWRITFLGADTPVETVRDVASRLRPAAVVLAAMSPERFEDVAGSLQRLAAEWPLALAGAGATPELGLRTGAALLRESPFAAAERLSRLDRGGNRRPG